MLWSFLLIPQRITLHHPTVNFEVKSMLFQLCYRSNTDCIFRLRGGCNCARSEVANYERTFISQINVAVDENGLDNIQSQRQIFQVDISNKTSEMFKDEMFIHTIQQLSIQNLLSLVFFSCY